MQKISHVSPCMGISEEIDNVAIAIDEITTLEI